METDLLSVVQFTVGMVFLWSSLSKAIHADRVAMTLMDYGIVVHWLRWPATLALILVEGFIAVAHLSAEQIHLALLIALPLLSSFAVLVVLLLGRGSSVRCVCFGAGEKERISRKTLVRLAILFVAEALLGVSCLFGWVPRALPIFDPVGTVTYGVAAVLLLAALSWCMGLPEIFAMHREYFEGRKRAAHAASKWSR